ncbi:alkaline phosphatase D family protein [Saccharomonospora iraqiensis]|uniref:alkaline phosphatase D family protein n=1 Tax=Saccharomonospora iraqiensis TaxID=52698 RepID=UPI00022DFC90|nr:alkaline phosphatase D family protein [Saccharomonospora iraqiensis]
MDSPELVLGPLLRHTDDTTATVWVETSAPCAVSVLVGVPADGDGPGRVVARAFAPTFTVSGHHYALVVLTGLDPDTSLPYTVSLDDRAVWPEPDSPFPPARIRTLPRAGAADVAGSAFRLIFGSCRKPAREPGQGTDALERYARRMAAWPEEHRPRALLLLGDQVYADEVSDGTAQWLATRRGPDEPPGAEVVDFEEYAHLYHETWSDPAVRWLMATVPVSMIFDDHDVRDDWNISQSWREAVRRQPWWAERLRSAFVSYWVYQHLGNLSPAELSTDPTAAAVLDGPGDKTGVLRELAEIADDDLTGAKNTRWSYRRTFGRVGLLMVDTRAGRILADGRRSMLDLDEFRWVEDNAREFVDAGCDHLLLGSSLPWLLPPAISHVESLNEAACRRGGWRGRAAEAVRQAVDLEHWAAFRASFDRLTRLIADVGGRADAPASVLVLSGDVHHSYVARARFPRPLRAAVYQVTCSPLHNAAPGVLRAVFTVAWWRIAERVTRWWSRRAGVAPPGVTWSRTAGPCFANAVTTLELTGRRAEVRIERVVDGELTGHARVRVS